MIDALSPYRKAIAAAIVAALTTAVPLLDGGLTLADVLTVLAAAVAAGGGVYAVPNKPRAKVADD